jgi:putative endonuclease
MKTYFVYILTNKNKTTLYIGVTNNLQRRLGEHKEGVGSKFTKRYNIHNLIYYETFNNISKAIDREKQLKGWSRMKKEKLIETVNSDWKFISETLF